MLVLWKSLYLTHLKKDGEEVKVPNFYLKKIEVFFFNINTKKLPLIKMEVLIKILK